jgi:exodeoxyribonuclease VII small subunit
VARKQQKIDFEASISELEELVEKMEHGEFTLEESLKQFERGVSLARACQKALREAEQKVQQLISKDDGETALAPFRSNDIDEAP